MLRYTIDGSEALEARIQVDMDRIRDEVLRAIGERNLTALVLGGAYGRGEGAVYADETPDRPFGAYDLFVVTPNQSPLRYRALQGALQDVAARLGPEFGVTVRFARVLPAARVPSLPYELELMAEEPIMKYSIATLHIMGAVIWAIWGISMPFPSHGWGGRIPLLSPSRHWRELFFRLKARAAL